MKESIYEEAIRQVSRGSYCTVDFKKRIFRINGKIIKTEGKEFGIKKCKDLNEWLDEVEQLYDDYKYSKPTKRCGEHEKHAKFKALSASQLVECLGHGALNAPISRNVAQAKLEMFILLSLLDGTFNPDELFKNAWFYQGLDKSFILRKDWF